MWGVFLWNMRSFKNTFFIEYLRMAASAYSKWIKPYWPPLGRGVELDQVVIFRSSHRRCSMKKLFEKISQNSSLSAKVVGLTGVFRTLSSVYKWTSQFTKIINSFEALTIFSKKLYFSSYLTVCKIFKWPFKIPTRRKAKPWVSIQGKWLLIIHITLNNNLQMQSPKVSYKKDALKNLYRSFFLIKLQACRPAVLLKVDYEKVKFTKFFRTSK